MVRFERQPPGTAITRSTLSMGALLAALAAWFVIARAPAYASAAALASGVLLLIGGHRANHGAGGPTDRMLDELLDRVWDGLILGSLAWVARADDPGLAIAALVALCISALSAYVRARGASLDYSVEESHLTRGLHYVLVAAGVGLGRHVDRLGRRRRLGPRRRRSHDAGRTGGTGVTRGETPRETIAFHAYRSVAALARALPEAGGRRVFRLAGRAAHDLAPDVRSVVARNQAQVMGRAPGDPVVRAATKQAFESYARYWFDSFRFPVMPCEQVASRFEAVGAHHLWRALDEGRGAIVALPHVGNWDAAGPWLRSLDRPIVAVAEQLRPARLYELFVANRTATGVEILGLGDGGIGRRLAARSSPTATSSRSWPTVISPGAASRRRCSVGSAACRPGPAQLSIATGAPLLVTPVFQVDGGWRCVMTPPLDVERTGDRRADMIALTRRMAREFERAIAAAPTDWHMFQPAWED